MKALSKYALNKSGLIQADPFAGYEPRKVKEKFSTQKESDTLPFSCAQVGQIIDHCASKFDADVVDHWLPVCGLHGCA